MLNLPAPILHDHNEEQDTIACDDYPRHKNEEYNLSDEIQYRGCENKKKKERKRDRKKQEERMRECHINNKNPDVYPIPDAILSNSINSMSLLICILSDVASN